MGSTERAFYDRKGNKISPGTHRFMYGHDILSFRSDNPVYVLIKQHGPLKGVLRLFQHLVGDMFSVQGLPLPGLSYFITETDDGRLVNSAVEMLRKAFPGTTAEFNQVVGHVLSIRMQDILAHGFTWGLTTGYCAVRKIEDEMRRLQISFVAYFVEFLTHATIGMVRTGGLPFINWPALGAVLKVFIRLIGKSRAKTAELELVTLRICEENVQLEARVYATGKPLISHASGWDYVAELDAQNRTLGDLLDYLSEK